jgi:hapalindole H/12-epi-hapalindole U/12-epi-fischerindole U synthase
MTNRKLLSTKQPHYFWLRFLVFLVMRGLSMPVVAAPVVIVNPGFESIAGESPYNEFTFGPFNGWALYDPNNVTSGGMGATYYIGTLTPFQPEPVGNPGVYANFPSGAAEGQRLAIAFNFEGSHGQGEYGYQQTLAATLQPLTRYVLEVEIGNIASATAMDGTFFDLDGFPGYRVELLAGGVPIAQDINLLSGMIDDGEFETSTITFTTGAAHPRLGQQLGIRLVNLNQLDAAFPDSDLEVDFDDVRLDASLAANGDFTLDGVTDAADYVAWRRISGSPAAYDAWRSGFGSMFGGGGLDGMFDAATIPELPSISLIAIGIAASIIRLTDRSPQRKQGRSARYGTLACAAGSNPLHWTSIDHLQGESCNVESS